VYIYACVYISLYKYIYTHIYIHIYIYTYIYLYTYVYIYMYMYVHMNTYAHAHIYSYMYTHIYIYTRAYLCIYACMRFQHSNEEYLGRIRQAQIQNSYTSQSASQFTVKNGSKNLFTTENDFQFLFCRGTTIYMMQLVSTWLQPIPSRKCATSSKQEILTTTLITYKNATNIQLTRSNSKFLFVVLSKTNRLNSCYQIDHTLKLYTWLVRNL